MPPGFNEDVTEMKNELRHITVLLAEVCGYLRGDGTDDRPGLVIEVDRLKQREKIKAWVLGALATPVLGLVAAKMWELMR